MNDRPQLPLSRRLAAYQPRLRVRERGSVTAVGDGIAWVEGLPSAGMDQVLKFADGSRGLVFEIDQHRLGAILLQENPTLQAGTSAEPLPGALSVAAGDTLLGRVVNALGEPLDGGPALEAVAQRPLEAPSPSLLARRAVNRPLYSGTKIIDTLIPMGKGQRQLLIGDEGTGRSSLAIDAVISQKQLGTLCVYCLIGQRRTATLRTVETLRANGALDHTVVVTAEASGLAGMKYLAPFTACAIAEEWMHQGRDTLVVYDDLSTHALAYRELSLLLRRPPGREAYPGDIFHLHARLLERSTALDPAEGGGTMTALPIAQTQEGEIAAFIPTNLISITDGQVYLDRELFEAGVRPAIDIGRSVSRIGGQAQHPAVRSAAGRMRLEYLQFLEMEVFSRFGARLEASMAERLRRGRLLREVLKQDRLEPVPVEFDLAWMTAYNQGLLDALQPGQVTDTLAALRPKVEQSGLTLESPADDWLTALRGWLETGQ